MHQIMFNIPIVCLAIRRSVTMKLKKNTFIIVRLIKDRKESLCKRKAFLLNDFFSMSLVNLETFIKEIYNFLKF